jgi:hypothetical protein
LSRKYGTIINIIRKSVKSFGQCYFLYFQISPSRIPGPQSLGKKEICREGWDLGFIYPNETSPSGASLGEKVSFQ